MVDVPGAHGGPNPEHSAGLPAWARGTLAWPLALFAGFFGTWLGLQAQMLGLAAFAAVAAVAPLYLGLLNRRGPALAAVVSLAWAVGVGGSIVGVALEGEQELLERAIPFVDLYRLRTVDGSASVAGSLPAWAGLAWIGITLAAARATRGLLALLSCAFALGVVESGAAEAVLIAVERGINPASAIPICTSPFAAVEIAGVLIASAALAHHGLAAPAGARAERPRLLAVGSALCLGAWSASLFLGPAWARWLSDWVAA